MMSLTFGLFNQVSGLGPLGPLVFFLFGGWGGGGGGGGGEGGGNHFGGKKAYKGRVEQD